MILRLCSLAAVFGLLAACSASIKAPPELRNLAKSDTAFFVEAVRTELDQSLQLLLVKLYRRNPVQLPSKASIESRIDQLEAERVNVEEFGMTEQEQLVRLAFADKFNGDRVFAFVSGLQSMVNEAFDYRREYFLLDSLPRAQFVYNSARNIETAAYLLRTQRDLDGQPFLHADGVQDGILNASYSQLMGQMIGLQDALASTLSHKDQRTLNAVTRGVASTIFLPVGL